LCSGYQQEVKNMDKVHEAYLHSEYLIACWLFSSSFLRVQAIGERCKIDKVHITNFGEEVVRGLPLSVMSPFLQRLEPTARAAAGGGAWQVAPALHQTSKHCAPSCASLHSVLQGTK